MSTESDQQAPPPARRPTIYQVARLAGVSHQTVSRYLRHQGGLKPSTRARVVAAIRELDYRPNLIARSMRTRRTGHLAVLMPPMAYSPARLLAGATAAAHDAGYTLDIHSPEGGAEARTDLLVELASSGQVEGVLSFAPVLSDDEPSTPDGAAIVIAAEFDDEMRGIGMMADAAPVVEFVEGLARLGHRRFLHVSGDLRFPSARSRRQAYLESIDRLALESVGVHEGDWSGESGIEAIRSLPAEHPPTAVIAGNDLVAAGVIRGAYERGWSVPEDISVTGWDNDGVARFGRPSLTTVDVRLEDLGHLAMEQLVVKVHGGTLDGPPPKLQQVIWRESTAAPRRSR